MLPVGLKRSMLEDGVSPCSISRAAGRLHVDSLRDMPPANGMSGNPAKFSFLCVCVCGVCVVCVCVCVCCVCVCECV